MIVMDDREWLKRTYSRIKRRSKKLQDVDDALKAYSSGQSPKELKELRKKFEAWKLSKGVNWRKSSRNGSSGRNAITELDNQLKGMTGVPPEDMANARLGVLYLFGHTDVHNDSGNLLLGGALSVGFGGLAIDKALSLEAPKSNSSGKMLGGIYGSKNAAIESITRREGDPVTKPFVNNIYKTHRNYEAERVSFSKIIALITDFVRNIANEIKGGCTKLKYQKMAIFNCDIALKAAKNIITHMAKQLFEEVSKQVGGGLQIFKGLVNTLDASVRLFRTYWMRRKVNLMVGHPAAICDALHKSMRDGILGGFYDFMKGVATTAASFLGGVASGVFKLVVSILETITKFVFRLRETIKIRAFLVSAREHWDTYRTVAAAQGTLHTKTGWEGEKGFAQTPGFHREKEADDFHQWFRESMLEMPILAALAMHSGICGDKMRFLDIMTFDLSSSPTGKNIKSQFIHNVKYLDSLKNYSNIVLSKSHYKFYSKLPDVNRYINHSKNFIGDTKTMHADSRIGVWGGIKKFANA
jgi:hypothetical protein